MDRRGYPPEFGRCVVDLLTAGRKVADLARDLGEISNRTLDMLGQRPWTSTTKSVKESDSTCPITAL